MIPFEFTYKKYQDHAVYTPVAGPTIKEAIQSAFDLRDYLNLPVIAILNEISLTINEKSIFEMVLEEYYNKLHSKYNKNEHNR